VSDNRAYLRIIVPENARVWLEGVAMTPCGRVRDFYSPVLNPRKVYEYTVRARWGEGGDAVDETRTVDVRANAWAQVDFTRKGSKQQGGAGARTKAEVLRSARGAQRLAYRQLADRVERVNKAGVRPAEGRKPAPSLQRVRDRGPGARQRRADRERLQTLAGSTPAVRALLDAPGRVEGARAVARVCDLPAFRDLPAADKIALGGALRDSRYLSRLKSLHLLRLSRRWAPQRRALVDRLVLGLHPSRDELAILREQFRAGREGPDLLALAAALREGLWLRGQDAALRALARSCGGTVYPGGPGAPVSGPYVFAPTNPKQPNGSGVALSVSPGEDDPTVEPGADGGAGEGTESKTLRSVDDPAGESLRRRQTTRRLRLRNTTRANIVVFVQYRTPTGKGEQKWFPAGNPDGDARKAVRYEVPAGQTVDVKDNDWQIHASKARVWAEGGGKRWHQFKDTDLSLVPEKDEDDNKNSYNAAVPQHATLAFN
jgi:uncharacterized protein (TIGR03000 family)